MNNEFWSYKYKFTKIFRNVIKFDRSCPSEKLVNLPVNTWARAAAFSDNTQIVAFSPPNSLFNHNLIMLTFDMLCRIVLDILLRHLPPAKATIPKKKIAKSHPKKSSKWRFKSKSIWSGWCWYGQRPPTCRHHNLSNGPLGQPAGDWPTNHKIWHWQWTILLISKWGSTKSRTRRRRNVRWNQAK